MSLHTIISLLAIIVARVREHNDLWLAYVSSDYFPNSGNLFCSLMNVVMKFTTWTVLPLSHLGPFLFVTLTFLVLDILDLFGTHLETVLPASLFNCLMFFWTIATQDPVVLFRFVSIPLPALV